MTRTLTKWLGIEPSRFYKTSVILLTETLAGSVSRTLKSAWPWEHGHVSAVCTTVVHSQWHDIFLGSWPVPEDGPTREFSAEQEAALELWKVRRDAGWKALIGAAHLLSVRSAAWSKRIKSHIEMFLCLAAVSPRDAEPPPAWGMGKILRIDGLSHLTTGPPRAKTTVLPLADTAGSRAA